MLEDQRVKRLQSKSLFAAVLKSTSQPFSFCKEPQSARSNRSSNAERLNARDAAELGKKFEAHTVPIGTHDVRLEKYPDSLRLGQT